MNRVKPPYKFKSPYWTQDPAGKQNDKYRFGLLSFGPDGGFKEINNSESNYYKACTLDLDTSKLYTLRRELREAYVRFALKEIERIRDIKILELLSRSIEVKIDSNKEYTWNLQKCQR